MLRTPRVILLAVALLAGPAVFAADVVPTDIQQPGTQPGQVGNLETPDKCDNCHGGYNKAVEPAHNWRGSMMANAGRDPIFWATLAIAEQDFNGSGDLCIRCHSTAGWQAGRSTPTDGSALTAGDSDGVECDACHKMTNPDGSEHAGVQTQPFVARDDATGQGYHGSGMLVLSGGAAKLGPYADADARHQFAQSRYHRSKEFCGSCHDVSNAAVGDLAHNHGAQPTGNAVVASGVPGAPVDGKAAFNNFPFRYGVVERTWSEFMSGALSTTPISSYSTLPPELQAGAIKAARDAAVVAGTGGNYEDGTTRTFTCQTCHLRPVTGPGANKAGLKIRKDLPLHDMTGGNYWAPDAILEQNRAGTLRLGGGLTSTQIAAINDGKLRAQQQLNLAASLKVTGDVVRVTNLTGHKLISGYPEGRRMWLNVRWYDAANVLLREDGKYDVLKKADGQPLVVNGVQVKSLVDLSGTNTRIYEAHYGMTRQWASQLLGLGYDPNLPLSFDRINGTADLTLGALANSLVTDDVAGTFHFVLNNSVAKDNRIPPYGMQYEKARERNALPVPASQYGAPTGTGTFNYYDDFALSAPAGAAYAQIRLMYQSTSWEYVQFLWKANTGQNAFLGAEGVNLLNAWLATGMSEPHVMATATWGSPPAPVCATAGKPQSLAAQPARRAVTLTWSAGSPAPAGGYRIYYLQAGKTQFRAGVGPTALTYKDTGLTSRMSYTYVVTAWNDCNGNGTFDLGIDTESVVSDPATATAQ